MKRWFCYIVECRDTTLYCGITTNIKKRIAKHNSGKGAKYCATRRPVILRWFCELESRSAASKEECRIKKLSREEKLNIIHEN